MNHSGVRLFYALTSVLPAHLTFLSSAWLGFVSSDEEFHGMKFPFLWISLAFGLGILLEGRIPFCNLFWVWTFFWIFLPAIWLIRQTRFFLPSFMLLMTMLGYIHASQNHREPKDAIHHIVQDQNFQKPSKPGVIYGAVVSQPEMKIQGRKRTLSFVLEASKVQRRRVSGKVQVFLFQPPKIPEWGDKIRLWGWLETPKPVMNPGEFDYRTYLKRQGIQMMFQGYGKSLKVLENSSYPWLTVIFKFRQWLMEKIESLFTGNARAVFKALVTGSQKEIPDPLRDDFMKTGTSHLLAVSGLNITLIVGSFFCLFLFLGIPQKAAALLSLVLVVVYALIAGCGAPVLRAAWMSGCVFCSILIERERNTFNALCFAFFVLILISPDALYQIGFQLSFLSVAGLMFFTKRWDTGWSWLESFQSTLAATLTTLPLVLYYFHVVSWISLVANLFAIPLFHLAQMMGFFALMGFWIPWLNHILIEAASWMLQVGLSWIHLCAKCSWGYEYFSSPSMTLICFYYFLLFLIILFWKFPDYLKGFLRRFRFWILGSTGAAWLFLMGLFFFRPQTPEVLWTFFSAGKNEIVSFQVGKSLWLIHAGRGKPSSQVRWTLEPYLRSRGIRTIEGVIMSDLYRKHWGGLESLTRNFKVKTVLYPEIRRSKWLAERTNFPHSFQKIPLRLGDNRVLAPNVHLEILDYFENQLVMLITIKDQKLLVLPNLNTDRVQKILKNILHSSIEKIYLFSGGNYSLEALELLKEKFPKAKWIAPSDPGRLEEFVKAYQIEWVNLSRTGALLEFGRGNSG